DRNGVIPHGLERLSEAHPDFFPSRRGTTATGFDSHTFCHPQVKVVKRKVMARDPFTLTRARVAPLFLAIFGLVFYHWTPRIDAAGSKELAYYQEALGFIRGLSSRAADLFDEAGQRQ